MLNQLLNEINNLPHPAIIAIDGRCAAGKTTLAEMLQSKLQCNVIHLDDFFLRKSQRTEERLNSPGGNIDYERFVAEVLLPLKEHRSFSYKPYLCKTDSFGNSIKVTPNPITIIEGSYACHPNFRKFTDFSVFLDISYAEQLKRIENRNGAQALITFRKVWIPLEEDYFRFFNIQNVCDMYIKM